MAENNKLLLALSLGIIAIYLWSKPGQEKVSEIMENLRRGERIHNPGNIRKSSTAWQGLASKQPDPAFAAFISPFYGLRAMAKVLLTYYRNYGLDTIAEIVQRYAPNVENDTAQYIANVALWAGISPTAKLNLLDGNTMLKVIKAMIRMEQGRNIYTDTDIKTAISSALGG